MPAHTKGEGQSQGAAGTPQLHEDATHVVHTPWGDWTPSGPADPHAMMAYVDHDHHEPSSFVDIIKHAQAEVAKAEAAEAAKTPEQRAADARAAGYAGQLVSLSQHMNDKNSRAFIQTLDSIDDKELRHKVMADFEAKTGQSLESFIKGCNDWNNNGDNRDKAAALSLISAERDKADDELAAMSPEERAAKQQKIKEDAAAFINATNGRDHGDENSQKIFRLMEKKSPAEMEMLRAEIRNQSNNEFNLYERIDFGMHKGDETEAVALTMGNHVAGAMAALANEDDPKRLAEVVGNLSPADRAQLNFTLIGTNGLARFKNASDRAVVDAALKGDPNLALGEQLGNALKPKEEGMQRSEFGIGLDQASIDNYDRRKSDHVLSTFEGLSGEQVKAAAAAWDKAHPDRPMMKMLEARWGNDEDKTEFLRLKAMIEGDKGKDRSLRLQESMRKEDKDEREAALRHEKVTEAQLHSDDPEVRKHAEEVQAENESFERANVEADHNQRVWMNAVTGRHDDTTGHSTNDQMNEYFARQAAKDTKATFQESEMRFHGDLVGADVQHMADRAKHIKEVGEDRIAAMELLNDGKLSPETEFHRGKGAKEKADALENVQSNKELEATKQAYKEKYGEEMLPDTKKDRSDMNASELQIDNVRRYGARAERPAQLEYVLQEQQVKKQYSASLEMDEDGRGTQEYQRIKLDQLRQKLKDPKFALHAPKIVTEVDGIKLPVPQLVDDPNEPSFDDLQVAADKLEREAPHGDIHQLDDGLKEGVKKSEFTAIDRQLVEANKTQEEAKKRLAERFIKIFSTIAKIAAVLTANPWLIAAIDIGEGLIEMGIKHEVMGEAYDPAEDLKTLAITGAADIALLGLSKLGELKGAAKIAEAEALGEKAAMEAEHAATAEAKSEVVREGAHAAAGESKALEAAIEEGGSVEKAAASEAASKVEQKAADVAEGTALHEGESAAAKTAESEVAHGAEGAASAEKAAEQIKARYNMLGGAAKMGIQTVGGGIVSGKSPSEILKGLVTGGLGLVLPGHLAEKVKGALGSETLASKILGEIAGFGTEVTTNTTINVAGGAEGGGALLDSALGAAGARAQHLYGGHAAVKQEEEHAPAVAQEEPSPHAEPEGGREPQIGGAPEMGAEHVSMQSGDAEYRVAANTPAVIERANQKMAAMDEVSRAQIFAQAENRGHQVLVERAIAAGRSKADLDLLMAHMSGKSEAEVLLEFSGAGLIQFYKQSCVPASYQIALAERDPVWALHFKTNPEDVMAHQQNALIIGDSHQTPRTDAANVPALQRHHDDPGMARVFAEEGRYSDEGSKAAGIDPADMKGTELHKQLEAATGSKYEVLADERFESNREDARFSAGEVPHERIGRALDEQKPVLIGTSGHERVIIGREVLQPGDRIFYIVTNPHDGTTRRVPKENLAIEASVFTLPKEGGEQQGGASAAPGATAKATASIVEGTSVGASRETTGANAERDARIAEADPLREKYGPARLSHPEEFEETIRKLEEAGVEVDFRPGQLGYSPAKGEPGRFIFDPEGSIGALRHEYQHFLDHQAAGFPGIGHYMQHPEERWASEYRAYKKEIDFARSQGDYESARRLLELARAEKRSLLGDEPQGAIEPAMGARADDEPSAPNQEQIAEVFTGPSLESTEALAEEHPGAHMIAAEATHPPEQEAIDLFHAAGHQFLQERFAESLPPSSLDKMYARYPIPHAKGVENMSARLAEQVKLEKQNSPGISELEANLRAVVHLEAEIESATNLGPHALDKLAPGGTLDVVYKEQEIARELQALETRVQVDPRTGETFHLAVVSGPTAVPGSIAPHSGWGLRNFGTDMSTVFEMILQKVLKK